MMECDNYVSAVMALTYSLRAAWSSAGRLIGVHTGSPTNNRLALIKFWKKKKKIKSSVRMFTSKLYENLFQCSIQLMGLGGSMS